MKTTESITSFFRRAELLFGRASSFCGRLDQRLVQSSKRVIVFEYPHILQSADTVEEATAFLLKEKEAGRARYAAVYRHDTDVWHQMDITLIQARLQNREPEEVPQESRAMKAIESITSFFRHADFSLRLPSTSTGFTGRLDQSLVHSGKRVIVFEYPHLLQSADTVEEATTFLFEEKGAGRALRASVYRHDTDAWCEVNVARQQNCLPTSHVTSDSPTLAP
jgi:acyl-coenzyme A synthetase/AMP-(fatty) acid ligase